MIMILIVIKKMVMIVISDYNILLISLFDTSKLQLLYIYIVTNSVIVYMTECLIASYFVRIIFTSADKFKYMQSIFYSI